MQINNKGNELYPANMFICTDNINFREYFSQYSRLVEPVFATVSDWENVDKEKAIFSNIPELNQTEQAELIKEANIEKFTVYGEKNCKQRKYCGHLMLDYKIPEKAYELKIIMAKEKWMESIGSRNQRYPKIHINNKIDLKPFEDIIVTIKVYNSFICIKNSDIKTQINPKVSHNVTILGSQKLTDLRKKLICSNDLGFVKELSEPVNCIDHTVKDTYPSGFIFIDNCFYNDMRHENAIDYSKVIRDWAQSKNLGEFSTANMEDVCIIDLAPRFGYPYLYQHQGDCEHILVFSEAHLVSASESLDANDYPNVTTDLGDRTLRCFMCTRYTSSFLVVDSARLPYKHCYLCEICLKAYNYVDGKKLDNFFLYPYFDTAGIVYKK